MFGKNGARSMDTMTRIAELTAECIKNNWPDTEGLPEASELRNLLAVPPDPAMGDYAFPCFKLAKVMRKAPAMIAADLAAKINGNEVFEKVENVNAYVNMFMILFI